MSYVIHIWEQPEELALPANPNAVWPMLDRLSACAPGPNRKYIELARQLMAMRLDIDGADGDELVWNLALRDGERLATVIVRANALGLHVADEQIGQVFLAKPAASMARGLALADETPTEPAPL